MICVYYLNFLGEVSLHVQQASPLLLLFVVAVVDDGSRCPVDRREQESHCCSPRYCCWFDWSTTVVFLWIFVNLQLPHGHRGSDSLAFERDYYHPMQVLTALLRRDGYFSAINASQVYRKNVVVFIGKKINNSSRNDNYFLNSRRRLNGQ